MNYLYSQELVAVYSPLNTYWDGEQSVMSKSKNTARKSSVKESKTVYWMPPLSSETSESSSPKDTPSHIREWLMSSPGDSHARTYPVQDTELELMETGLDFGNLCSMQFAQLNQDMSSWKTAQCLLFGDLEQSLEIWPRMGMMQDGVACRPPLLDLLISGTEYGLWPTPVKTDDHRFDMVSMKRKEIGEKRPSGAQIGTSLKWDRRVIPYLQSNGRYHPNLSEWLMGWPITWSALEPLEMDRFQQWLKQHGRF